MFESGTQVWLRHQTEEGGIEWWPAKVVTPELEGLTRDGGPDAVYVQWYSEGTPYGCASDPTDLMAFADGEEHRNTSNPLILQAIAEADRDETVFRQQGTKQAPSALSRPKPQTQRPKKTHRSEKRNTAPAAPEAPAKPDVADQMIRDDAELVSIKSDIDDAIGLQNVPLVRRLLLTLARTKTDFRQLKATGIGVSVCGLLAKQQFAVLWGLARIVVRSWAQELPEVSKVALRSVAAMRAHQDHPQTFTGQQQPPPGTEAQEGRERGKHFSQRLRDALVMDGDPEHAGAAAEVAEALESQAASSKDRRVLLIETLEKPGHVELRRRLLTTEVSAADFFMLPKRELMTPQEQKEDDDRRAAQLAAKEASEASLLVTSELFECPKCGKRKCTFYEQQTRGGDEPMTQFVTCRECGFQFQKGGYE